MTPAFNIENTPWKLILYAGAIITFASATLIAYFLSTMTSDVKNSATLSLIVSFGLFFVLFFLVIEVYDLNKKFDQHINTKKTAPRK